MQLAVGNFNKPISSKDIKKLFGVNVGFWKSSANKCKLLKFHDYHDYHVSPAKPING
jgi:hypothetical protein